MRRVIILWLKISLGIGVFTLPYYFSKLGWGIGILAVLLTGFINIFSYYNIFKSSVYLKEKTFEGMIVKTLGSKFNKIF